MVHGAVKRLGLWGWAVALPALLVSGCGQFGGQGTEPDPLGPEPPTEAEAGALWAYLEDSEYHRFWDAASPSRAGLSRARRFHGPLVRAYVNPVADDARPLGETPLPPGSVVVLEDYNYEPHIQSVHVMAKIPGHNEATNDWAFYRFSPEGGAEVTDAEARRRNRRQDRGCIHCHSRTRETDFLFTPRLR